MLQSKHTERLTNKEDLGKDKWISLESRFRIDYLGGLGAQGLGNRRYRWREYQERYL